MSDFATYNSFDRFGSALPQFTLSRRQIVQSPDGAHIYLTTNRFNDSTPDTIHILERASAMRIDETRNHNPSVNQVLSRGVATVGQTFVYRIADQTFADADGDSLVYSAEDLPRWLAFDTFARTFSGTPGSENVTGDPIEIRVFANDGSGGTAEAKFALTVLAAESELHMARPTMN